MRYLIITIILLSLSFLGAAINERYQTNAAGVSASLANIRQAPMTVSADPDDEFPDTGTISRTFALPFQNAQLTVQSLRWNVFDQQGNFLYEEQNRNSEALSLGNSFTFREMRGFTVLIRSQIEVEDRILTLTEADFTLTGSDPIELPTSVSPAFVDAYKTLADNYESSYLRDLPTARPKMLILSHNSLSDYLASFVEWKKSLGFDIFVANKSEIGSTLDDYKNFIRNHYLNHRCDYLLLLGDVTGSFSIPTAFYPSPEYQENDADDYQYTLITGDDYFPEMLVGRFSFNDVSEYMSMANKTIIYERSPYMGDTGWMTRSLAVAGNYAEGGLRPTTPIHMSRWLREKMLNHGYAQVDTVFYPPTYPGTTLIQSSINQGVQFVSYRGWGDANGWHYPSFYASNLDATFSGPRMPIVFSIVCNTGDFANPHVNPCFGEKWMRMGTMVSPNGAVAFVGPSDLHTKTRLNNSISSGAFRSILDGGVRGFGASVLAGKMELYKNFPNDIAPDQYVPFYFHVYNLLSDPSLNMWVLVPNTIPESVIEGGLSYAQSDSHIRINAPANEGAMVTGTKNGVDFTHAKVQNGLAILPIDPEASGDLKITVSQPNFVPLVRTLSPSEPVGIGIIANDLDGTILNPNQTVTAHLTLKNYSEAPLTLSSLAITADAGASVDYGHSSFTIPAEGTHNLTFSITGLPTLQPRQAVTFTLHSEAPAFTHSFQMWGGGARFMILNTSDNCPIGATSSVTFNIFNIGLTGMEDASVQVVSLTTAATFPDTPISLGQIGVHQSISFETQITVGAQAWNGRHLPLKLIISDRGYETLLLHSLTAGTATTTSPTGPDAYGYYAYDSTDLGFEATPTYQWVETDPLLGGQGSVFLVMDDGSKTVDLPFTFRFYGEDYNHLTMCSNGWISLLPTDMVDFYNHYIPAALGPYAMIAGYWDDLKGMKTGVNSFNDMRVIYWHDVANNRYIVQWNDAYNQYTIDMMENASLEKFQIILYPRQGQDGDIVIQYHTVDNPGTTTNYCTVGIEDETQLIGLQYTHGNTYPATAAILQPGLAIKFTTTPPDNYLANDEPLLSVPFALEQNYPNPFNPSTTISFTAKDPGHARLAIYNLKGQLVRSLLNSEVSGGKHSLVWDGRDDHGNATASGIYLYKLELNGATCSKKMLMLK